MAKRLVIKTGENSKWATAKEQAANRRKTKRV